MYRLASVSVPPNIPGSGLLKLSYTVTLAAKIRLGPRQVVSAMRPENTPIRMTAAAPIGFRRRGPDSLAVEDDQGYADKCIGGALLTARYRPSAERRILFGHDPIFRR